MISEDFLARKALIAQCSNEKDYSLNYCKINTYKIQSDTESTCSLDLVHVALLYFSVMQM